MLGEVLGDIPPASSETELLEQYPYVYYFGREGTLFVAFTKYRPMAYKRLTHI